ncbi:hypothetical protein BN946_scf184473.g16 [Trametes cinnabarina]|uniref:Uncharacterized protein n=1 Tax=Pycnoporus cinnabarinus TaxID=5643 RepID=A0A060SR88_PYCCI|nr:hypothetical protein BN946_scf184473.g16 [Trametes cinnabarina]
MNGIFGPTAVQREQPGQNAPQAPRQVQRQPQISQALLQGAREISAILERRMANLRAEYEEKLKMITRERDELLAQSSRGAEIPEAIANELEALRDERDGHEQEHVQWETERTALLKERARYQEECEELRKAQATLREEVLHLQKKLEEEVATKDAAIASLEERVKVLEATNAPDQRPATVDQNPFDLLDVSHSPRLSDSAMPPDIFSSTLGTISPQQDSVPMQVRTPPSLALPFDLGAEFDDLFTSLGPDQSPPKSPTITIRGGQSPSVARSPTLVSLAGASSSSSATRLVIRVPPAPSGSAQKPRKPIKPPITPPTEEEMMNFIHVPRMQDSSDEVSPSGSSSGSPSTDSSATHSP